MDNSVQNRGLGVLGEAEKTLSGQQHGDCGRGRPFLVLLVGLSRVAAKKKKTWQLRCHRC